MMNSSKETYQKFYYSLKKLNYKFLIIIIANCELVNKIISLELMKFYLFAKASLHYLECII